MKRRSRPRAAKYRSLARRAAVFVVLLSIILLFTWNYIRSAVLGALIKVETARAGTLEDSIAGEALFAGGRSVVVAPISGSVKFLVKDGESVRVGQPVAEIGDQGVSKAFDKGIEFAKAQLALYEEKTQPEFDSLVSRLESTYESGVEALFQARKARAAGRHEEAQEAERRLLEAERAIASDRARLSAIEDERARLANSVASIAAAQKASVVQVLAPASGVFSSKVDPMSARLKREVLLGKDATELMALAREAKDAKPSEVKDGQVVKAGDAVGQVVSGQEVTFFLPLKTEDKPEVEAGREVTVTFVSGGLSEAAVVADVADGRPPGYSVIVGEIAVMPSQNVSNAQAVNVVVRSRTGTLVPRSAVLERDGKTGVLLVQKTYARFAPVEVLMTKGDQAVVRGITAGEEVVARAIPFLEGKRVR